MLCLVGANRHPEKGTKDLLMVLEFEQLGFRQKNGIWYASRNADVSYPDHGNGDCFQVEEHSFWFRHRNNCICELVKRFSPTSTFFDIGGGNGFVAKAVQDMGIDTVLVEPGEQGCRNARNRNVKSVVCSTVEDAGFEKESIPAVGVFDVVEHFEDDLALLRTVNSYMVPGGHLFITVPAFRMLWSTEDDFAGHYHRYTLKTLRERLREVGFETKFETYIFSILPLPVFLLRSIPSRLGLIKRTPDQSGDPNDHKIENPLLSKLWAWELSRIHKGSRIPVGGSCLVVARKI